MERYAVIGIGQFGSRLAQRLTELGAEVLAIDNDPQVVEAWRSRVDQAIVIDATDEAAFTAAGLEDVDTAVVAIGRNLEVSVLVCALLHRLGVRRILARASSDLHAQILRAVGAHDVTNPEQEMGDAMATRLVSPHMHERLELPCGHEYAEIDAPASMWGKTLAELDLQRRYGVTVIALRRTRPRVTGDGKSVYQKEIVGDPAPDDRVEQGDVFAAVGVPAKLRELARPKGS